MRRSAPLLALAALFAIGVPSARAGAALVLREAPEKATLANPLFQALGSAREAAGDMVFMRADAYFHKGMDAKLVERHHAEGEAPRALTRDWAMRVNERIKVTKHEHLSGADAKEVLPLLYASSVLNPQNLDAVLTAAYWLEKVTGTPAKSLEVLKATDATHPSEWKIEFAIGQLLEKGEVKAGSDGKAVSTQKNPAAAIPYYEKAISHLNQGNAMPFDWIRTRVALADALAATQNPTRALMFYKEALALADQRKNSSLPGVLRQKIKKLEAAGL